MTVCFVLLTILASSFVYGQIDIDAIEADEEFRWGIRAFHSGFYNDAILSFTRSLSIRPEDVLTRFWLGRSYYYAGFEEAALGEWRTIIEAGDGNAHLQNLVETLTFRRGLGRELSAEGRAGVERYTVTASISGQRDEAEIFSRPANVRSRSDGSFLMTSFATHEILLIDANGVSRQILNGGLEGFDRPFDIIEHGDFMYVSEYGADRISVLDGDGFKLRSFGASGIGDGEMLGPQYLTIDDESYIYVSDFGNGEVDKFSLSGEFILSFGRPGFRYAGLSRVTGVAYQDGFVYVADSGRRSIEVFDVNGNHRRSIEDIGLRSPEGIVFIDENILMIADDTRIVALDVFQESSAEITNFAGDAMRVTSAAEDANGNLVAADFDANAIRVLSPISALYSGLHVQIDRVNADSYPRIFVDVSVQDREGRPIVGLDAGNFVVTEGRLSVGEVDLERAGYLEDRAELVLLADRSLSAQSLRNELGTAAARILNDLTDRVNSRVVSAGVSPVLEVEAASTAIAQVDGVSNSGPFDAAWSFDLAARFSVGELIPTRGRKAVLFFTDGSLSGEAFEDYGLVEITQYYRNNNVSFFVVSVANSPVNPDLVFLAEETGGAVYRLFAPTGLDGLAADILATPSGQYTLSYDSITNTDFGRAYIPLEIETILIRRSGRDEAGYLGPLEF